ncbi:BLUF domain-containing protein [Sphingomonas sp. BGYR3]|uniref:BLUF domain-containing protein n=1 Tax=Sphingomonas sp. BGYR3 TaxID=2975483 RepID=UPI0021A4C969|nr:BLUF domain-containing protein [Sphingomonas sp. BGYR3]MDG5487602.1 BLUF domain-containing protein [Sphingomonas sp. BGYR3]
MLQIVYVSSVRANLGTRDISDILTVSRRNNERDGITGLLYSDGGRFLQVLEGPQAAVEATFARISKDARHRATVILARATISERQFGNWAMAHLHDRVARDVFVERVHAMVAPASPAVRATFEGFAQARRAA